MTYEKAIKYLFDSAPMFQNVGAAAYKEGLGGTLFLDEHFGHPHRSYRCIHVGGTNGKGSVTHTLAAILQAQGYRVGLYTSPHLVDFRERIRVNGKMISKKRVIDFARQAAPLAKACYHHVEAAPCDGVEVELHYRPAFLNNPLYNHRLQRWFQREAAVQSWHSVALADGTATLNVPTDAFNRIYQMAHIMNHVIHEGVGMRQMMDYYFLLMKGFTAEERQHDERLLRRFGLYDMAGAVMYVLQWLFVLPEDKMLVAPDKRRGVVLLKEILYGGNFGRYHQEAKKARSQWAKNALRSRRDLRLLTVFPSECLCEPLFRLWHFGWRLCHQ